MKKNNKRIKEGFIYIISNEKFKGFYKIGVTIDINSRLNTYQTSDPERNYKVEYYIFHSDCYTAEKKIKEMMKYFAKSQRNEWYEIPLHMAITRLDEQLEYDQ